MDNPSSRIDHLDTGRMHPSELTTEESDFMTRLQASLDVLNREMNSAFGEIDQMTTRVRAVVLNRGVLNSPQHMISLDQLAAIAARVIADQVSPSHDCQDFYGSLLDHAAELISQKLLVSSEEAARIIFIQLAHVAAKALRS